MLLQQRALLGKPVGSAFFLLFFFFSCSTTCNHCVWTIPKTPKMQTHLVIHVAIQRDVRAQVVHAVEHAAPEVLEAIVGVQDGDGVEGQAAAWHLPK